METFQNLTIELPSNRIEAFYYELSELIRDSINWHLRNDLVANFNKNSNTKSKYVISAESKEFLVDNRQIQGIVWLWNDLNTFKVFNIVPAGKVRNLELNEYNYILNQFKTDFIDRVSDRFDARVNLTHPYKYIDDTIGSEGISALRSFSEGANKTTGNTNPYDFQRWCEFIFIIHRMEKKLSSSELENWLIEDGWDEEMASKLSSEFEYSLDLLEKYEQSK
ncbi:hypothetical protein D3C87_130260 [compost metagenome]